MKNLMLIFTLIILSKFGFSQNHCTTFDELLRKRHKIANMTYGHPYTTFDRHNKITFENTIQNIRDNIKKGNTDDPIRKAYKVIYDSANTTHVPTDNGMEGNKEISPLAIYAKNCAFVFLIGLDGNGNPLCLWLVFSPTFFT